MQISLCSTCSAIFRYFKKTNVAQAPVRATLPNCRIQAFGYSKAIS
jgi:hypothetical protein